MIKKIVLVVLVSMFGVALMAQAGVGDKEQNSCSAAVMDEAKKFCDHVKAYDLIFKKITEQDIDWKDTKKVQDAIKAAAATLTLKPNDGKSACADSDLPAKDATTTTTTK